LVCKQHAVVHQSLKHRLPGPKFKRRDGVRMSVQGLGNVAPIPVLKQDVLGDKVCTLRHGF
jgi:hypothetical protein